jgi:hypothetical protein
VAGDNLDNRADRALMYSADADLLSGVRGQNTVKYVYGANGQQFSLDSSMAKDWKGSWQTSIPPGGKVVLAQQLMTWPGSSKGWLATPELTLKGKACIPCRVITELGGGTTARSVVLPMSHAGLVPFIRDEKNPLVLREWAVGWLAALPCKLGQIAAGNLLLDAQSPIEVRKAAARWLATQAPPHALSLVVTALWSKECPGELQRTCFYALTWSPHPEAKALIQKGKEHPDSEIKATAQKQESSQ